MSYLGKVALKASDIRRLDVTSSTSATHTLTWTPPNEQSLIITINGVKQQNNYSISGVTLTLDTALVATDEMEVIGINDIGTTNVPGSGVITNDMLSSSFAIDTADLADDAVTADKLANSINTEIAANTAKVTNATHTGDVTGATALTIANDAVDIAMLSASGTASATTFLRGDNAWAAPVSGGITDCSLWVLDTQFQGSADPIASNLVEYSGNNYARIGSAMTESSGVFTFPSTGMWWIYARGGWYLDNDSDRGDQIYTTTTTDFSTGPTWVNTTIVHASLFDSDSWTYNSASSWYLFDVTDVAECKVRFKVYVTNSNTYTRHTTVPNGYVETSFMFTRIGDT